MTDHNMTAPIPPLTANEVRAELQRLRRIMAHVDKLSDPGKRWLLARVAADAEVAPCPIPGS